MEIETKENGLFKRSLPVIFGIGAVLFAFHSNALTITTKGDTWLFLPQIAALLMIGVLVIYWMKERIELGPKVLWVPLLILALSPAVTMVFDPNGKSLAGAMLGLVLFFTYLYSRKHGVTILNAFFWPVLIVVVSIPIYSLFIRPGLPTGGLISPTNYDAVIGFLVFGALCYTGKYRWLLVTATAIGIYFSGSSEGLLAVAAIGIMMLIRRDLSKNAICMAVIVVCIVLIFTALGTTGDLWDKTNADITKNPLTEEPDGSWEYRKQAILDSFDRFSFVGNGYDIYQIQYDENTPKIVHNVPLIILDQIGVIPFLAWIWITGYCLIKTRWKYAWVGLLSLCVFDHYYWSTLAPYWWILVGASTSYQIKDTIFKKEESVEAC